ncbi:PREDICTED: probable splicing factor 3A subunit 1 [Camelina sativa]|uniref:Probable splicing factor 3A subunit 1 n=1 Tax=Camelina sativa TaxID=90675 RepID=A0ABM1QHC7_CAMSA|nr:PREDICTED: probable splicing factor 3A subunit 1 [Camelina sativa]XP_019086164.1 PREDICTED: probable splicing factor 3A subunit 1 [Camelina sativa]XP_019086165.1 PREDICTED: probable splicing factor 3A subunit 1 [Camelina sativa]
MSQNDLDLETMIDIAAVFIFENGVEYEEELLETFPSYSFVDSSDPNHGLYQKRLMEYRNGTHDEAVITTGEIVEPPPGNIKTLIERTADYVSKEGDKAEKMIRDYNFNTERYQFMKRSNPLHAFYQKKLAEYRSQKDDDDGDEVVVVVDDEAAAAAQQPLPKPQFIILPNCLQLRLPPEMSLREFDTMKLTAHFAAWYGSEFWLGLAERNRPELGFMNSTDRSFRQFTELVVAYTKVLTPLPTDVGQELSDSPAFLKAIIDAFLKRIQWDPAQHYKWLERGEQAMLDWHASVANDFANKDQFPPLPKQPPPPPLLEEPNPKRQRLDESAPLVPEDQFLAQHPGSSTIKVSVPNADGGQVVIEITVQSLSESVASLKEKIAGEIQIPASTHKLTSGKARVLEDNDKSLAHYNVGPGDTLTLSL